MKCTLIIEPPPDILILYFKLFYHLILLYSNFIYTQSDRKKNVLFFEKKKKNNHEYNFSKIFSSCLRGFSRGVFESIQTQKHRKKLTSKSFVRARQFKTRILFSSDCKSVTFNQSPFIAFYRDSGLHSQGGKFDGNYHEIGWPFRACQVENFPND